MAGLRCAPEALVPVPLIEATSPGRVLLAEALVRLGAKAAVWPPLGPDEREISILGMALGLANGCRGDPADQLVPRGRACWLAPLGRRSCPCGCLPVFRCSSPVCALMSCAEPEPNCSIPVPFARAGAFQTHPPPGVPQPLEFASFQYPYQNGRGSVVSEKRAGEKRKTAQNGLWGRYSWFGKMAGTPPILRGSGR